MDTRYLGIAIAVALLGAWRAWTSYRNSLPDDERAEIYWNDQRFERLQWWITAALWTVAALLAVPALIFFAMAMGWIG